jgi:hypothetical protein
MGFLSFGLDQQQHLDGYYLKGCNQPTKIFADLERSLPAHDRAINICLRFLDISSLWSTRLTKRQGIWLDLVFLVDVELDFYRCTLCQLPYGLQRLVLGQTVYHYLKRCMDKGGITDPVLVSTVDQWFTARQYCNVESLWRYFEEDRPFSECNRLFEWMSIEEIGALYEGFVGRRQEYFSVFEAALYFERRKIKPKNATKYRL